MIAACREGVSLIGIGSHVPERVMTNDEIATMVETSDEWISQRTGIHERRIAAPPTRRPRSAPRPPAAPLPAPASTQPSST